MEALAEDAFGYGTDAVEERNRAEGDEQRGGEGNADESEG